ncbi:hypothetical protein LOAG_14803, partial [Loa loa]
PLARAVSALHLFHSLRLLWPSGTKPKNGAPEWSWLGFLHRTGNVDEMAAFFAQV